MSKIYTGVGSRETPKDILDMMENIGYQLARQGWTLRSGGADGADRAFEDGWWRHRMTRDACYTANDYECFLPWEGYNDHTRSSHDGCNIIPSQIHFDIEAKAEAMAAAVHPAWSACKQGAKKMHTRNVFQVLGRNLDTPSKMLIAWTRVDGKGNPKGGTATAINLAHQHLPAGSVFNLNFETDYNRIKAWLEKLTK